MKGPGRGTGPRAVGKDFLLRTVSFLVTLLVIVILTGCATLQGYQRAGVGGVVGTHHVSFLVIRPNPFLTAV